MWGARKKNSLQWGENDGGGRVRKAASSENYHLIAADARKVIIKEWFVAVGLHLGVSSKKVQYGTHKPYTVCAHSSS